MWSSSLVSGEPTPEDVTLKGSATGIDAKAESAQDVQCQKSHLGGSFVITYQLGMGCDVEKRMATCVEDATCTKDLHSGEIV